MNTTLKTTLKITLIGLVVACAMTHQARAWNPWVTCGSQTAKWKDDRVEFRLQQAFGPSDPYTAALVEVMTHLNFNPSRMTFGWTLGQEFVWWGNGRSEIWWTDTGSNMCSIWIDESTCEVIESDITFSTATTFTTSHDKSLLIPYGGSAKPFQTTALHELGHSLNLDHTGDRYSIMGEDWTHMHANGGTARAYFGADATEGSVQIYGADGIPNEDLGVAQWRFDRPGEYSDHARTRVFATDGVTELPKVTGNPEPVYEVSRGQRFRLEMTYENLGKTRRSSRVSYVLSENDLISTVDPEIGSGQITVNPYNYFTTTNTWLTIPETAVEDQNYWLGAIVDPDQLLSESNESNNGTYIGIRIKQETGPPPSPNLIATSIRGPKKKKAGKKLKVRIRVNAQNHTGSIAYEIRLSQDRTIDGQDLRIFSGTVSGPGLYKIKFRLPSYTPKGRYTYGLVVVPVSGEVERSDNTVAGGTLKVK